MIKPRIYGILNSRALRPLWVAKECDLDLEHIEVRLGQDGTQSAWFRELNPNAAIPVMQDGDLTISQSLAIALYIAKRYGKALYPGTLSGEARTWQWTLWTVTELEPHVVAVLDNLILLPPEMRSQDVVDGALTQLRKPLAVLDQALGGSRYLLGDEFTIADMNVAAVLYPAFDNRWVEPQHHHALDWLTRCWSRPAARQLRDMRTVEKAKALADYWDFYRSQPH